MNLLPQVALLMAILTTPLLAQDTISINFRGATGRGVGGTAGVLAAPSWNNLHGGSATLSLPLIDDTGTLTGARISFASASNGFQLNPPGQSQDAALFDGQIIATTNGLATVSLRGIPFANYDVYAYFGHGPGHAGASATVAIGATKIHFRNENLQTYVDPIVWQEVTTTTAPGALGNYARLGNLSSANVTLTLAYGTGSTGLAGLQIHKTFKDIDRDGLDDDWETRHFGNLNQTATGDTDKDALQHLGEFVRATDPNDPDSDDDRSTDGNEVAQNTDPLDPDSDNDMLLDGVETNTRIFVNINDTGTNPNHADTDGDKVRDAAEIKHGKLPEIQALIDEKSRSLEERDEEMSRIAD